MARAGGTGGTGDGEVQHRLLVDGRDVAAVEVAATGGFASWAVAPGVTVDVVPGRGPTSPGGGK